MTRYFAQNTPRAGLEHMMMSVPGFQKRGGGMMILSRFCYKPEDVDCRYCLHYRRRSCQVRTCPYIAERLKSGAIEYLDLILEYFGHIPHAGLHKRIQAVEHWSGPDQAVLHTVSVHLRSRFADRVWDDAPPGYLAALYLLASKERLWQPALPALSHDSIDFSRIVSKPHGFAIQDYPIFYSARRLYDLKSPMEAEDLAHPKLVSDLDFHNIIYATMIARYHANRTRNLQRNEQWRRLVDYLYGRNIELQTFGSIETRGIRPLREGDLTFSEEIILSGHGLNFQFDFTSDEAQREVLGPAADCLEPGGWLDILCNYDAARQEADATLSLTLHRQDGVVQKLFTYPLGKEERALLRKQMEADYLGRTGKTLNDYYAQLDMEREAPPELTAGTKRLPVDAVSFTDEITECDGKLNFYIPINFDPDAVFGTNVASAFNDDWLNVYANFGWKTGRIDSALTVCLVCSDGHEFEFFYPLTSAEQVQLWNQMDAYCHQQNGQSLGETRTALLREQAEEGLEIRL